jgi:hypothetical protein
MEFFFLISQLFNLLFKLVGITYLFHVMPCFIKDANPLVFKFQIMYIPMIVLISCAMYMYLFIYSTVILFSCI